MDRAKFMPSDTNDDETTAHAHDVLSAFQKEKLGFYFSLLDVDKDGKLSKQDVEKFSEKMVAHNSEATKLADVIRDANLTFYEGLLGKTKGVCDHVSLESWLDAWVAMLKRTMALTDLPYSVQLHCKTLFKTIDRDDDGVISLQELQEYYRDFIGMQKECVEAQACAGYKAMTANGSYKLDMTVWGEMYANMLLGKQVYGPGEYIFGVFAIGRETEHFKLTMPSMEDRDEARSSKVNHVPHVPRKKLVIRS